MWRWGLILILVVQGVAVGQSSSAADAYRIAAGQVPVAGNNAEQSVLQNVLDAPLFDGAAGELLRRGEKSLQLFDAASGMYFGDWGLDELDPTFGGRMISGLGALADLVVLRARQSAADGKIDAALEDCRRLALLSRRLSTQPSLSRQMQQNVLMDKALRMAATLLPTMSAEQIDRLISSLHELPSAASPTDVARTEQESYLWLYGKLIENHEMRRMTSHATGAINLVFGIQIQPINIEDLARDPQLAQDVLNQTRDVFAKMIDALQEPSEERSAAMKIIPTKYDFSHDLSRGAAQIVYQAYFQNERHEALMDLFQCAAAIYSDPARPIDLARAKAVAGRFEFRPVEDGFELGWRMDEEEITLRTGSTHAAPATRISAPDRI